MKSIAKFVLLFIGSALLLSGCSAVSSMLMGHSKEAAPDMQEPSVDTAAVAEVPRFTFYDSFANW